MRSKRQKQKDISESGSLEIIAWQWKRLSSFKNWIKYWAFQSYVKLSRYMRDFRSNVLEKGYNMIIIYLRRGASVHTTKVTEVHPKYYCPNYEED